MRINKEEAKWLRENNMGEFVIRSSSNSGNYHLLCGSTKVVYALNRYHESVRVK